MPGTVFRPPWGVHGVRREPFWAVDLGRSGLMWCRWKWLEAALEAFLTVILTIIFEISNIALGASPANQARRRWVWTLWPGSDGPSRLADPLVVAPYSNGAPYCILIIRVVLAISISLIF